MNDLEQKRYYSVAEANELVPELAQRFGAIIQMRAQLHSMYQSLVARGHTPALDLTGTSPPIVTSGLPDDVARDAQVFRGMAEALREQLELITETGCVIRDIDDGLVDWPAQDRGRDIWLCWRYGEPEVAYYHELNTGFAGRRPVSELQGAQGE